MLYRCALHITRCRLSKKKSTFIHVITETRFTGQHKRPVTMLLSFLPFPVICGSFYSPNSPCTPLPKSHQTLQNTNCIIWPHICLTNYSNTNYNALNFQFIKETIQRAHQNLVVGRPNTCERSAACRRKRETFSKRTLFACTTAVSHDPQIFSFIPLAFNIHIKTSGRETL